MSDTQRIVVYTPMEDALYNSGMGIPIVGGLATGVVVFLALIAIANKVSRGWRGPGNVITGAAVVAAFAAGALVFHHLFI